MLNSQEFNDARYGKVFSPEVSDHTRIEHYIKLVGKGKKILDVGCWDGTIAAILRDGGNSVKGVEISDKAIELAKAKGLEVFKADLTGNWAKGINEKFDLVMAGEIIEHVFDTDLFLQNIKKVLKKNGELIVSTPNVASLGRRLMLLFGKSPNLEFTARNYDSGHVRYFTLETLCTLLKQNGFRVDVATSNIVNFSKSGSLSSKLLAKIWPQFGTTLIIKATNVK